MTKKMNVNEIIRKRRRIGRVIASILSNVMLISARVPANDSFTKVYLNNLAETAIEKFELPAVSISVINSESITHEITIGKRQFDEKDEVSSNDLFHVGSCSKSILAFIAAKLVEENKIAWNTRFFEIYPELASYSNDSYLEITLSDLLTSRAGIKSFTRAKDEPFPEFSGNNDQKKYAFLRYLVTQPSAKKTKDGKFMFLYSNASYVMASAMLERATESTYVDMLKLHLLDNLSIPYYIGWPNTYSKDQPWGHMIEGKKITKYSPENDYKIPELITPAGDLSFKPSDFAKYVQLHLQGLRGDTNYLNSNSYERLHFGVDDFSMGVANGIFRDMRFTGFDGSAGTFYCRGMIFPDSDFAFLLLTNSGSPTGSMKAIDWLTKNMIIKQFDFNGFAKAYTWLWW